MFQVYDVIYREFGVVVFSDIETGEEIAFNPDAVKNGNTQIPLDVRQAVSFL